MELRSKGLLLFTLVLAVGVPWVGAQSGVCLNSSQLGNTVLTQSVPSNLKLKIDIDFLPRTGAAIPTLTTLEREELANEIRRHYGKTVAAKCDVDVNNCCGGFINVDGATLTQSTEDPTKLHVTYFAEYSKVRFQKCPSDQYQQYFTGAGAGNEIYNTISANSFELITKSFTSVSKYGYDSQLCDASTDPCGQGNSVCHESTTSPTAECISVCNDAEYTAKFGESYCNGYTCCQTSNVTDGQCQCSLYESGNFVFGNRCSTKIPLWAMILIIVGGILLLILLTILLIYCCCPACCMCCFASRVERMKQAKKVREEKRKEAAEEEAKRRAAKATTPIRQVARDANSFYAANNSAYLPERSQRETPPPLGPHDDRFAKSVQNGRVLSSILGASRMQAGSTTYRVKSDTHGTLMESSLDEFQTGEPSIASSQNLPMDRNYPVHNGHATASTSSGRSQTATPEVAQPYLPKGAVPSIGPQHPFNSLVTEIKQSQDRNRSLSSQIYKEDSRPHDRDLSHVHRRKMSELNSRDSAERSEATSAYRRKDLWRSPGADNLPISDV